MNWISWKFVKNPLSTGRAWHCHWSTLQATWWHFFSCLVLRELFVWDVMGIQHPYYLFKWGINWSHRSCFQLLHSRLAYLNCASLVIFYEQSRAAEACQAGTWVQSYGGHSRRCMGMKGFLPAVPVYQYHKMINLDGCGRCRLLTTQFFWTLTNIWTQPTWVIWDI